MSVLIQNIPVGGKNPLVLIAGPCVVESRELILRTAEQVKKTAASFGIPVIFKSSYKKANRTSGKSFSGIGVEESLRILQEVKSELGLPLLTDIHTEQEAAPAAEVVDVLQIPAFLCRQTDLLHAAGKTGKAVNIKKGQFLAPDDVKYAIEKARSAGNEAVCVTERGATFGYHNLVVDMRGLAVMRRFGCPVVFDATHSVQLPGGAGDASGGQREFAPYLARAAAAVGVDAVFMEVHENPDRAKSDGPNSLPLAWLPRLFEELKAIDALVRRQ
jgi:2-dehydro-3-deoxyphosphooctonate aldolase (KDO 8-P synthase)